MVVFVLTGKRGRSYTNNANGRSPLSALAKVILMSRLVAHLWVPGFYAVAECMLSWQPKDASVVITRGRQVLDASPGAKTRGIEPGMPVSGARLMCPEVIEVGYDPGRYDELADRLWEACAGYSPAVEPLDQHEAFIDLVGGPDVPGVLGRLSRDVEAVVGVRPVFGVACCKLVARVASGVLEEARPVLIRALCDKTPGASCRRRRSHPQGEGHRSYFAMSLAEGLLGNFVATGKEMEFLAPMPVGVLWIIDRGVIERLLRLGVRTVGEARAMGRSALVDVLGEAGYAVYECSLGIDRSKVAPVYPKKAATFRKAFGGELTDAAVLAEAVKDGAAFIERELKARAAMARRWCLEFELAGGAGRVACERRLAKPPELYGGIAAIYRNLLRKALVQPGPAAQRGPARRGLCGPVEAVSLTATDLVSVAAALQVDMFDPHMATSPARAIHAVAGRVREKFGAKGLFPASLLECDRGDRLLLAWEGGLYHEEGKQVDSGCGATIPAPGEVLLETEMASGALHC